MRKWIVGFTALFLALLAADVWPGLRGGSGWRWPYAGPESWPGLIALAALLLVYLAGCVWLRRRSSPVWAGLLWAFGAAAVLGVAVTSVRGDPLFLLFTRTVSPVQTGASALAVRVMAMDGLHGTLEQWPDVMASARDANLIHFATSPPGQPLAHYALANAFDGWDALSEPLSMALRVFQCSDPQVMASTRGELVSAAAGMLMPLWAALAVFPVYGAAVTLTDDRRTALRAALWWPLIPTVLLFAPTWNTLYPLLCAASFALLLRGLEARSGPPFVLNLLAAGAVMSVATFLNLAVLPALLLFGLFTLGIWWLGVRKERSIAWPVIAGLWFGIGLSLCWLIYWLAAGVSPLDVARVTFDAHGDLVQRDYLPWLLLHPYDTLLFVGWPLAGLFGLACWRAWRERGQIGAAGVLARSMLLTLLLVNLAGVVQGENGRILSYYAPFLLLAAVPLLAKRDWDLPLLGAQAACVLVMAAVLPVVPLDLNPRPEGPRTDVPAFDDLALTASGAVFDGDRYAGRFVLADYRFVANVAEQIITLETHWQGDARTERPYRFEVVARAENEIDGQIVTEPYAWYPQNGNYLTTCWAAGDTVRDVVNVPLPPVSMPVVWTLSLRAVDERTGHVAGEAEIGPISYP